MKPSWQDIRANWVNGNLGDCRKTIKAIGKKTLIAIMLQCLEANQETRSGSWSGDCDDLIEILSSFNRFGGE